MDDERLLQTIARCDDTVVGPDGLPRSAWSPERAFFEIKSRISGSRLRSPAVRSQTPAWTAALVGFAAALLIGGVTLLAMSRDSETADPTTTIEPTTTQPEPGPTTTTTSAPSTTAAPSTTSTTIDEDTEPTIPEARLETIARFFESISDADLETLEGLFAPGGEYVPVAALDDLSSGIDPASTLVGSPELREFLQWWYGLLQMDLRPLECSGDAQSVTCVAESTGVAVLYLPGGAATGTVKFTFGPAGLIRVEDQIDRSTGGDFDIRGFWRTWMPEGAPELEQLWPNGNGRPDFSRDIARVILQYYPRYLDDRGIDVPPQYLDGSLLPEAAGA